MKSTNMKSFSYFYKIISFYRLAMIHRKINAKVIKEECNRFHSLKNNSSPIRLNDILF